MGSAKQIVWTWIAAILTLSIFSFLYRDNPFYKFAEHLLVGTSVGYSLALAYIIVLKPSVIDLLLDPDMSIGVKLVRVVAPTILGLCYVGSFTKKFSWIARYPIAFIMGWAAGLSLPMTMLANILRQLRGTFAEEIGGKVVPLISIQKFVLFFETPSVSGFLEAVYGPLIILGVFSVMLLFIFSVEQKGVLNIARNAGIVYLMIGFGAAFGYTVMARISLLVGRIDFLLGDWLGLL